MKATFSLDGRYLALLKKLQDVLKYFNVRIFKSKSFQKKKRISDSRNNYRKYYVHTAVAREFSAYYMYGTNI